MFEELNEKLSEFEKSIIFLYSFLIDSEEKAKYILYSPMMPGFLGIGLGKPSMVEKATNKSVISFYERFERSLEEHLDKVKAAYKAYRKRIKEKLYV
jgi:hypothetical protein